MNHNISIPFATLCTNVLQYTFTATPVGGGTPVTVSSTDPDVRFQGLQPGTEVRCTACAFKELTEGACSLQKFIVSG